MPKFKDKIRPLTQQMAENISHVNETATAIINGKLPETYSVNYNYFANSLNSLGGDYQNISFTLVDENTVKLLSESDVNLLPYKTIDGVKDVRWNVKKINAEVLQGILQGESVYKIAGRFQNVLAMDEISAIRNARTTLTSAENKGRMDMMARAQAMGIKCRKIWMSASDTRTRPWHRELNGKIVDKDKPFENSIGKIMYPGDPTADGANVYNCRCSLGYKLDGFNRNKIKDNAKNQLTKEKKNDKIEEKKKEVINNNFSNYLPKSKIGKQIKQLSDKYGIEYNEVELYDTVPNEEEIINKIAGGDLTDGSCSSLALSFAANINGFNTTDFRGGLSQRLFSLKSLKEALLNEKIAEGYLLKEKDDYKAAQMMFEKMESGKNYVLGIASHSAIVRKDEATKNVEFLELQSPYKSENKFKTLTKEKLKERFGCKHHINKSKATLTTLLDASSMKNDEMRFILGYINTSDGSQMKGIFGNEK